ncbi:hypothetical protein TNCV_4654581 [Trichonephila clavipes]|nr:hypothetical protein TNCV_4654581 [Trichonephila clavipes]
MLKVTWPPLPNARSFPSLEKVRENPKSKMLNDTSIIVIPGVSYSQALNPEKSQQMAAPGKTSSASESNDNNKNNSKNTEALNAIQNDSSEFGFLQAILEIRKIFDLFFPSLLTEMKKSYTCNNRP